MINFSGSRKYAYIAAMVVLAIILIMLLSLLCIPSKKSSTKVNRSGGEHTTRDASSTVIKKTDKLSTSSQKDTLSNTSQSTNTSANNSHTSTASANSPSSTTQQASTIASNKQTYPSSTTQQVISTSNTINSTKDLDSQIIMEITNSSFFKENPLTSSETLKLLDVPGDGYCGYYAFYNALIPYLEAHKGDKSGIYERFFEVEPTVPPEAPWLKDAIYAYNKNKKKLEDYHCRRIEISNELSDDRKIFHRCVRDHIKFQIVFGYYNIMGLYRESPLCNPPNSDNSLPLIQLYDSSLSSNYGSPCKSKHDEENLIKKFIKPQMDPFRHENEPCYQVTSELLLLLINFLDIRLDLFVKFPGASRLSHLELICYSKDPLADVVRPMMFLDSSAGGNGHYKTVIKTNI